MAAHARRFLVLVQVTTQCERLTASTTDVRLVGRVRLDVSAQVGLVGERFATVRATERFLSGMRPEMTLEKPWSRESLAALRASAALTVRPDVHAVGRRRGVDFVAVRTLARRTAIAATD